MRTRAERRKNDFKKAIRKKNIAESIYQITYDNIHKYSKNKIHCSCPSCTAKTNGKGVYNKNYNHADKIKIDSMECKEKEFE